MPSLLPIQGQWSKGEFNGLCARGAFELNMKWENSSIIEVEVLSKKGEPCRINPGINAKVTSNGKKVKVKKYEDGSIGFSTISGEKYLIQKS